MNSASSLIVALNGATIEKITSKWSGFFEGVLRLNVTTVDDKTGVCHVELSFDTGGPQDRDDYIFARERDAGMTAKVQFVQGATAIPQRVTAIRRRTRDAERDRDEYVLDFDVLPLYGTEPLRVVFLWKDGERLAEATVP